MNEPNNPNTGAGENPLADKWANMDPDGKFRHITDAIEERIQEADENGDPLRAAILAAKQKAMQSSDAVSPASVEAEPVYENDYYANEAGEMIPQGSDFDSSFGSGKLNHESEEFNINGESSEYKDFKERYSYATTAERENKWRIAHGEPPIEAAINDYKEGNDEAKTPEKTKPSYDDLVEENQQLKKEIELLKRERENLAAEKPVSVEAQPAPSEAETTQDAVDDTEVMIEPETIVADAIEMDATANIDKRSRDEIRGELETLLGRYIHESGINVMLSSNEKFSNKKEGECMDWLKSLSAPVRCIVSGYVLQHPGEFNVLEKIFALNAAA